VLDLGNGMESIASDDKCIHILEVLPAAYHTVISTYRPSNSDRIYLHPDVLVLKRARAAYVRARAAVMHPVTAGLVIHAKSVCLLNNPSSTIRKIIFVDQVEEGSDL
jgi:hypothetical protein